MRDELKLRAQLDQLREQYMRETAPKSASTKQRTEQQSRIDQTKTPDKAQMMSIIREQPSRLSGEKSAKGLSPSPGLQDPSKQVNYQYPYNTAAIAHDQPSFNQYSSGPNEQLERLKTVQDEIDRKNNEERNEINKIMKEIMDTSRRFIIGSNNASPRYAFNSYRQFDN